jgi:Na+/melibiose symporter-like transporter
MVTSPARDGRMRSALAAAVSPYLLAHFAKSQLWHASTLLFGFFLTEACGLNASAMSLVMAATLALNGVVDAALGVHWRGRMSGLAGAARLQLGATPATCLFFLSFCATPLIGAELRLPWALATLLGFRVAYPFIDVPQNAMVALAPLDEDGRCTLLALRNVASGLASIAVGGCGGPLLIHGHADLPWLAWAATLSLLVCATGWWLARAPVTGVAGPPSRCDGDGEALPFTTILAALTVMVAASSLFRALEPYYAAYAAGGVGLLLWAGIGGLVSQPAWLACRRRVRTSGALGAAALALLLAALILLGPLRTTAAGVILAGLGFGAGTSGLWLMLWAAMMHRAAAGGATGYVGVFTCVSKLAQAAAMLLLGHVLAGSAYRDTLADPHSPPSLLIVAALTTLAATCVALALACRHRAASGARLRAAVSGS